MNDVDPRVARRDWATPIVVFRSIVATSFVLAMVGLVIGGDIGHLAQVAAVTVMIVSPLARVAGLILRWRAEGDRRFVAVGVVLLGLVALGGTIALMT